MVRPASADADVFVETTVDAQRPYVQQAVGVTVRLHYAIPLLSGQLDLDSPPNASLQRVGEDITYQRLLGGRPYNVVERRFLLVPERSGPLVLPGARLNGITGGGYSGPMFEDDRRPVSAAAPAVRLDVQPIPAAAPQPWLPLRGLSLRYLKAPRQAFAGQAAEVEIELVADGATAAQVPAITLPDVPGVQAFADPPQVEEQFVEGRPRTVVRRRIALVPARAGTQAVPGPRITWWDAAAGVSRVATLPDLVLPVAAAGPGAQGQGDTGDVADDEDDGGDVSWREWLPGNLWTVALLWLTVRELLPDLARGEHLDAALEEPDGGRDGVAEQREIAEQEHRQREG